MGTDREVEMGDGTRARITKLLQTHKSGIQPTKLTVVEAMEEVGLDPAAMVELLYDVVFHPGPPGRKHDRAHFEDWRDIMVFYARVRLEKKPNGEPRFMGETNRIREVWKTLKREKWRPHAERWYDRPPSVLDVINLVLRDGSKRMKAIIAEVEPEMPEVAAVLQERLKEYEREKRKGRGKSKR